MENSRDNDDENYDDVKESEYIPPPIESIYFAT